MKKFTTLYQTLLWLLTFLLLIAAALVTIPKLFGIYPYAILSSSMEPTLPQGSLAFVDTNDKDISEGDIVTFTMRNATEQVIVTHRAISVTGEGIITKGDANEVQDMKLLTPDRIIGICVFELPFLGSLMMKMTGRFRIVIIVWLLALHMFGYALKLLAEPPDQQEHKS
jgi:signal peptidase